MLVKACQQNLLGKVSIMQNGFGQTRSILLGQFLLLVLLASFLTGCGFHLRGLGSVGEAQFKTVQLNNLASASSDIQKALRSQLKSAGIQLNDAMANAEVQITLQATQFQTSRTAFSGQGDATAELLKMTQPFTATLIATEQVIVEAEVQTYRDRQIETSAMLAADSELNSIKREMADLLARQILDRINRSLIKLKSSAKDQLGVDNPQQDALTEESGISETLETTPNDVSNEASAN